MNQYYLLILFSKVLKLLYLDFNYAFSSNCDVMNLQADASEDFPDGI